MIAAKLLKSESAQQLRKRATVVRTNEKQQIVVTRVIKFQRILNRVERIERYPYTTFPAPYFLYAQLGHTSSGLVLCLYGVYYVILKLA